MTRPLRLEYPGSLWHITARGNERRRIFHNDRDRARFLELLAEAVRRFDWIVTGYVLMPNHYHLVVQLRQNTLSRGMKWLNGGYTQWFNRAHDRVGHLYQGRFKSFLIDKQTYFLEVLRYVVLNPVRACMVEQPGDYEWSSHRAITGHAQAPSWLAVDDVLVEFGEDRGIARAQYQRFVDEAAGSSRRLWDHLIGQMYLGSESWLESVRDRIKLRPRSSDHPLVQREVARPNMATIVSAVARVMRLPEERVRRGRGGMPRKVAAWIACYEAMLPNNEVAAALLLRSDGHVRYLIDQCERELAGNVVLRECIDRCLTTLGRRNRESKT